MVFCAMPICTDNMSLWVEDVTSKTDLKVCFLTAMASPLLPALVGREHTSYSGNMFLTAFPEGSFVSHKAKIFGFKSSTIFRTLCFFV